MPWQEPFATVSVVRSENVTGGAGRSVGCAGSGDKRSGAVNTLYMQEALSHLRSTGEGPEMNISRGFRL